MGGNAVKEGFFDWQFVSASQTWRERPGVCGNQQVNEIGTGTDESLLGKLWWSLGNRHQACNVRIYVCVSRSVWVCAFVCMHSWRTTKIIVLNGGDNMYDQE